MCFGVRLQTTRNAKPVKTENKNIARVRYRDGVFQLRVLAECWDTVIRSTQIYAKITEHEIAEDMQRAESRIEDKFQVVFKSKEYGNEDKNKKHVRCAVLY